jgi:outer membrane cobalamin receptor
MLQKLACIWIFVLLGTLTYGQDVTRDTIDLSNLSIKELSKLKSTYRATDMEKSIGQAIEAASKKPLTLRKSPSIISVITSEEIEKSGARDLMDVLMLIPGMEFNLDVEGVVALSFRGLWSNEGTISMQIDGHEVNEIAYASLQLGNHYPLDQIKKIEILRGPGSAIYGGCAEYAVINIFTKQGEDIKGLNAKVALEQAKGTYARQNLGFNAGNKSDDFSYAVTGSIGRGQRSNRDYTDVYNSSYNMAGNSNLNPTYLSTRLAYKKLSVNLIYDNYKMTTRDETIRILSKPYPLNFLSIMTQVKYSTQVGKKTSLTARLEHKFAEPWMFNGQPEPIDSSYYFYVLKSNRYGANVSLLWDPLYWLNVNYGLATYVDQGRQTGGGMFRTDSTDKVSYFNSAPFVQTLIKTSIANITAGARYDISTAFGSAFNPRLGATKRLGIFNLKLLYASSFRAPAIESIQNVINNTRLKPEKSQTVELEASVKLRKDMYISVNLFEITTANAIRYFVSSDTTNAGFPDGYRNSNRSTGSKGFEFEYKYKTDWGFVNVAYSFYTIRNKNVDEANSVPAERDMTLGTARNKLNIMGSINLTDKLFLSPSINYLGKRYGYSTVDADEAGILTKYKPQTTLNVFAGCNELIEHLDIGLGIYNLTNTRIIYPQAYNSLHAPLPGMGRSIYLKVNYKMPFKKESK